MSVFVTRMSWILSVTLCHMLQTIISPFCSVVSWMYLRLLSDDLVSWSFPYHTAQPVWMRGSSRMCEGLRIFRPGRRPYNRVHCGNLWWGSNFYSPGHERWRRRRRTHHSWDGGLGDIWRIAGIGIHAIHDPPSWYC